MWPILRQINLKNFYFYLPFLFVMFLMSFPLNLTMKFIKILFLVLLIFFLHL